jgi:hypothetical protein
MKRVNIDRDVQSRNRISASRPAPRREESKPKITEPPKDEPKEESKEETKAPEADNAAPAAKPKRSGRPPEGDA